MKDLDKTSKCKKEEKDYNDMLLDPDFRRREQMKIKSEAVWVTFFELDGIINVSKFAREYFGKSQSWFAQRVNGYDVNHKKAVFSPEEYEKITGSFRDLAERLMRYAEEIDKAQ